VLATIDHVTVRVADLAASRDFYARVFELLPYTGDADGGGFLEWDDFSLAEADGDHPPTRGAHIAFTAESRAGVDAWWQALTSGGYRDDGGPGPRPQYSESYYGAFLRDPDDNSIEAVHHDSVTTEQGLIDHLWIRVRDLGSAKRFYAGIAPAVGLRVDDRGDRAQFRAEGASFTILEGPPTENLHLAFGVPDLSTVADFHRAGLAAGGRDNGGPGERPEYHPGYYGAYVLDPDGNNIEAVFHRRDSPNLAGGR
jgi:catechol 2,3-dioxygenase-like lactoylglutathione lyase family enzyme